MELPRQEFEGKPAKMTLPHEARPPERPEKVPLEGDEVTRHVGQPRKPYGQVTGSHHSSGSATMLPRDGAAGIAVPFYHNSWWYPSALGVAQQAHPGLLVQRPTHARDGVDVHRHARGRGQEEKQALLREAENLRAQLKEANSRVDQAEQVAEELGRQLKARSTEVVRAGDDPADTVKSLKAENAGLKAELDDARSHIFSLQPYRKDLTPEEVGLVRFFIRA